MAALLELISEPDPILEVGNCIKWTFVMTGVSDDEQESRMVYWLEDETGQKLTFPEQLTPGEGQLFSLDLVRDLRNRVYTNPPDFQDLFTNGFINKPTMYKQAILHVEVITFDKITCESNVVAETNYGPYTVLSIASDWYTPLVPGTPGILNKKPKINYVHRKSNDWLYVYGPGIDVTITLFSSGGIIGDYTMTSSEEHISAIPIGPDNLRDILTDTTTHYGVTVGEEYFIYSMECEGVDLYFFNNGYSVLTLERESRAIQGQQSLINLYNPQCSPLSNVGLTTKGLSINNKESYDSVVLHKLVQYTDEQDLEYLRRFLASPAYFMEVPFLGDHKMIKFIVEPGSITYDILDGVVALQISGRINRPLTYSNALV